MDRPAASADGDVAPGVGDTRWHRAAALWAAAQVAKPLALDGLIPLADRIADPEDGVVDDLDGAEDD